jgi:hypothetical protein
VSSLAACGTPTIAFPASTGLGTPSMVSAGGTAFTYTVGTAQGSWSAQTYTLTVTGNGGATGTIGFIVSDQPPCSVSNLSISPSSAPVKSNGQQEIQTDVTITVTRTAACGIPTVSVTPGNSGPTGGTTDLTTPKAMTCTGLSCSYLIANGTRNWMPKGARTVTVTSGTSTVTGTLTLT